jgi:DNA topoisomerase IA
MTGKVGSPIAVSQLGEVRVVVPGVFENSAHPSIHLLNPDLTPEEFSLVFKANQAEVLVYKIIFEAEKLTGRNAIIRETTLTLYRKQAVGRRQVGIAFRALTVVQEGWLPQSPDHAQFVVPTAPDAEERLRAVSTGSEKVTFEVEDSLGEIGRMPFVRLLHLMEAARIGRPSTYAVTLKKLLEDKTLLDFERESGMVRLTSLGAQLGAMLETRCDNLSSIAFATTFDGKLNAVATGQLAAADFLSWVLSLTRPGDPFARAASAKLWSSVDDLRSDKVPDKNEFGADGGYISPPPTLGSNGPA